MKKVARPHQVNTLHEIKLAVQSGIKRIMVQLPTGGGKTVLAAMIIEGALRKGNRASFVVPAIVLIDQTVKVFWDEEIRDVGVIQSLHHLTDHSKPVQVCSVQTMMRRHPDAGWKVVIIDEAHADFEYIKKWMTNPEYDHVIFIGLSATPWTKGLGKIYQKLIVGETIEGLIRQGYLSKFKTFATAHPDLTGVKTVAGDYHEGQLAEVMAEGNLVASIVNEWLEKAEALPTLCFAVDRAHASKICNQFNNAGIPSEYMDCFTPPNERKHIEELFRQGRLKVVCNVGVLTKGVDWDVRCIILARPTKSEILYVQMIGRGLRTAPDKGHCTILDHADNTARLGFVTDIHYETLDMGNKAKAAEKKKDTPKPKECAKCKYMKPPKTHVCPNCGFKPEKQSQVEEVAGELVEVKGKKKYSMAEKQVWFSGFIQIGRARGYKPGWAANQYKTKFGVWPRGLQDKPLLPIPEVQNYVTSRMIAYAKGRGKSNAAG